MDLVELPNSIASSISMPVSPVSAPSVTEIEWHVFLTECVRDHLWRTAIHTFVNHDIVRSLQRKQKNALVQKMINFITFIISIVGEDKMNKSIYFCDEIWLHKYGHVFKDELVYDDLGQLYETLLAYLVSEFSKYRKQFDKSVSRLARVIVDLAKSFVAVTDLDSAASNKDSKKGDESVKITCKVVTSGQVPDSTKTILHELDRDYSTMYVSKRMYQRCYANYLARSPTQATQTSSFDIWFVIAYIRYNFFHAIKEGISLSVTIPYKWVLSANREEQTVECFAGPINSNLSSFCSLFPSVDKHLGSIGSFFDLQNTQSSLLICNPPFILELMEQMSIKLLALLSEASEQERDLTCLIYIPDWRSKESYEQDEKDDSRAGVTNRRGAHNHQSNRTKKEKNILQVFPKKINRLTILYPAYELLRSSEYFCQLIILGPAHYTDSFYDEEKKIYINTLILILSNNRKSDMYLGLRRHLLSVYDAKKISWDTLRC